MPSFRNWEFCRKHHCRDRGSPPHDRFSRRQWLQLLKNDCLTVQAMRTVLLREVSAWDLSRMSDDAVIDLIVGLLDSGRLHVHAEPVPIGAVGPRQSDRTSTPAPPPVSEREQRVRPLPSREPAVELGPPTLPSNIDVAAQVATLVAAAEAGVAACYI